MDAQEKIDALKKKLKDDQDKILRTLFIDNPATLLVQPQMALQMVMGVRGTTELLKMLDDTYEFKINGVVDKKDIVPFYLG